MGHVGICAACDRFAGRIPTSRRARRLPLDERGGGAALPSATREIHRLREVLGHHAQCCDRGSTRRDGNGFHRHVALSAEGETLGHL